MKTTPEGNDSVRQAQEDLIDIADLKKSVPFTRYWLRHLNRKRDEARKIFEEAPPEKCSHEEREIQRRIIRAYTELLGMMDQHQATQAKVVQASQG